MNRKLFAAAAAAVTAGVVVSGAGMASADHEAGRTYPVSQAGITPEFHAGNDQSGQLGTCTFLEIEGDGIVSGENSPGDAVVTFSAQGQYLSWEIGEPGWQMLAVLVKGGDAYHVYRYANPAIQADAWLASPLNAGGNIPDISHYGYCYGPAPDDNGGGDDGAWCSPGYWRNHPDAWAATGISPDALYSDYFGRPALSKQGMRQGASTDPTLWEVVSSPEWYGGDAFNVGDLLSTAHPDVDFLGDRVEDSCPLD